MTNIILGIDEVGRGPWAGPLVVGAVVLGDALILGLTDSKKLTKKKRESLDILIRRDAAGFGLGWVPAGELDEIGLSDALRIATIRAVEQIKVPYNEIIIDGTINFLKETAKGKYVTTLAKADLLIQSVSAASIIAKVARDNYMVLQDKIYPGYGFGSHVGYGTAAHRVSIDALGVTPLHRLSFAPLKKYKDNSKSTKAIGDIAEHSAAEYLTARGHTVLERNWKTKFCEIDIVSMRDTTIYFSEVKYRKSNAQGGGSAAITTKKLQQMKFSAEYYVATKKIKDVSMKLVGIAMTGQPAKVSNYLELD